MIFRYCPLNQPHFTDRRLRTSTKALCRLLSSWQPACLKPHGPEQGRQSYVRALDPTPSSHFFSRGQESGQATTLPDSQGFP